MGFAFVTSITPGPNNLMLMASGANFGIRRSVPHMLGIGIGFTVMVLLVGIGLVGLFEAWPPSFQILKVVSVAYLLWLAWKIAHAAPPKHVSAEARPMTFLQAAAFQWVNPKAWSMALGAITLFAASRELGELLWVTAFFAVMGHMSALTWTTLGTGVRRLLASPERLRLFNWTMAIALVASMVPVLL